MRVRTFFFERFLRSPPPGNKNKKIRRNSRKNIIFEKKEMFYNTRDFLLEPWRQRVEHPFKDSGLVQLC